MNIHRLHTVIGQYFRKKRMTNFEKLFDINSKTTILDVGGSPSIWHFLGKDPKIDILNVNENYNSEGLTENMSFIQGDGRQLKFCDRSYDIVYSNSVIEHVGTYEDQKTFAKELKRVGKGLFVQTPAKEFPLEPHYLTPFIHWFPIRIQRKLLRNFTAWGILMRPSVQDVERSLAELRLLNEREFRQLFEDCHIIKEKFLFLTKSYIAYRPQSD